MRPPFSNSKQTGAFCLLLAVLLLSPILLRPPFLPPREQLYATVPWTFGPFPYLHQQIFEETNDIDIALVGSSRILNDLNAPYLQHALSKQIGRTATVVTIGWNWAGFDANYFLTKDLLEHRKVHMILFTDECKMGDVAHRAATYWFRFADHAADLHALPIQLHISYYWGSMVGVPRNLLGLLRPNYNEFSPLGASRWEHELSTPDPATQLGTVASKLGFNSPDKPRPDFVAYSPPANGSSAEALIYSPETKSKFIFTGPTPSPGQLAFGRKFARLATDHHCKLVCLHLPEIDERRDGLIPERENWAAVLQADVTLVGISPAGMFSGLKDEEFFKLFLDSIHFNKNGQDYFSTLITPSLCRVYAAQIKN
jgi:hypothetical protein